MSGDLQHALPAPPPDRTGWPWTAPDPIPARYLPDCYPRISVVTPSYNQGAYIEETIRSVLQQGYPNLEYVVIDGGSTDDTPAILERYASFLSGWVSEPDEGQTHAINKGFARSTGAIMGWLNSDDMLTPGALFHIAHAFMDDPDTQVVTGLRKVIDRHSRFRRNVLVWLPDTPVLMRYCVIPQETTYWRREVWEAVGALNEDHHFAMDYEYWQRMLGAGYRFTFLPRYLGLFREHDTAKTTTQGDLRTRELARIYRAAQIATGEDDALGQLDRLLGHTWRDKVRVLKEFGHKSLSNHPVIYVGLFRLLTLPVIGRMLVILHHAYTRLRRRISR